MKHMHIN